MFKNETLDKIAEIHCRIGDPLFRMALQCLLENGQRNFTPKDVSNYENSLQSGISGNPILTLDFQRKLLACACELSQFSLWDVLLYVKLHVSIRGDNAVQLMEADQTLSMWNAYQSPEEWQAALADPDSRMDILREMVMRHDSGYSMAEIRNAIQAVVNAYKE